MSNRKIIGLFSFLIVLFLVLLFINMQQIIYLRNVSLFIMWGISFLVNLSFVIISLRIKKRKVFVFLTIINFFIFPLICILSYKSSRFLSFPAIAETFFLLTLMVFISGNWLLFPIYYFGQRLYRSVKK